MDGMNNVTPADLDKVLRELRDAMSGLRVSEGLREASVEQLKAELARRQTDHR
jgi:ribosomal protein L29